MQDKRRYEAESNNTGGLKTSIELYATSIQALIENQEFVTQSDDFKKRSSSSDLSFSPPSLLECGRHGWPADDFTRFYRLAVMVVHPHSHCRRKGDPTLAGDYDKYNTLAITTSTTRI